MQTIPNYNATHSLFLGYASSLVIGITTVSGQLFAADFPKQGLDLIDSFFIYALLAQFVHLGWVHLGLNLAGLGVIAWGFSTQRSLNEWLWIQALSLPWLAFYLTTIEPIAWYCGLSGALHFQFVACLLLALFRSQGPWVRNWPLVVLSAGLLAKICLEWNSAPTTDSLVGGPIAFEAHRGGALGGALLGLFIVGRAHLRNKKQFS